MAGFRFKPSRGDGSDRIDLHFHGKYTALQALHDKLEKASVIEIERVTVVTGRGLHSPGRKPIIRPAVDAFLDRNCYWRAPEKNPGRYTVLLDVPLDR